MVNIIEDWSVLEDYAGEKPGFYQLLSNDDGTIEIRVQTGKIGFEKEFETVNNDELRLILEFLQETLLHSGKRAYPRQGILQTKKD